MLLVREHPGVMGRDLDYGSAVWALTPATGVLVSDLCLEEGSCGRDVETEKSPG